MKAVSILFLCLLIIGCSITSGLKPEGKNVMLMKSDPPPGCEEIGGVASDNGILGCGGVPFATIATTEGRKNCMRNKAASMGANYLRYETETSATAYKCKDLSGIK